MTNILLISILVITLITMIVSVISCVVITKYTKKEELVKKVVRIIGIVLFVLIVILGAIGISYIKNDSSNKVTDKTVTLENAGFNEVTIDEYLSLINEDKQNIILIARPTCGYCEKFTPILKQAMDDMNLTINYIDTDKLTQDDWTKFEASLTYLTSEEWGTPLVLIVKNGEVVADNGGYVELSTIKAFFKANGYGE